MGRAICHLTLYVLWFTFASILAHSDVFWTSWIDRHRIVHGDTLDEFEYITHEELYELCSGDGVIEDVECRPNNDRLRAADQYIVCNRYVGLQCLYRNNLPDGCLDYKVRYRIRCHIGRRRREEDPRRNCNSWYRWVDDNRPSSSNNFSDTERVSLTEIAEFCPKSVGGMATKIQCADDGGEPRDGGRITDITTYDGKCISPTEGVKCWILNNGHGNKCPNLKFRFYCACPPVKVTSTVSKRVSTSPKPRLSVTSTSSPWFPSTNPTEPQSSHEAHPLNSTTTIATDTFLDSNSTTPVTTMSIADIIVPSKETSSSSVLSKFVTNSLHNTTTVTVLDAGDDGLTATVKRYLPFIIAGSGTAVFLPLAIVTIRHLGKYLKSRNSTIKPGNIRDGRYMTDKGQKKQKLKTNAIDLV